MTRIEARFSRTRPTLAVLLAGLALPMALSGTALAGEPSKAAAPSVISFIGHETSAEKTRVILHANAPIDYRGGFLQGNQVILDLANVETSLPAPVVELGAPEVDRVVIGPEVSRDGEKVLKVRLTGVRARKHKVQAKDNELHIDLMPLKGARDGKGLPKVINNASEVQARSTSQAQPQIEWAVAVPVAPAEEAAVTDGALDETEAPVDAVEQVANRRRIARPAQAEMDGAAAMSSSQEEPKAEPAMVAVPAGAAIPDYPTVAPNPVAADTAPHQMTVPALRMPMPMSMSSNGAEPKLLTMTVGRSLTLEVAQPVSRVSISNPAVAEPVAVSPTQILINGLKPGVVSLVLWPKDGAPTVYELAVQIDTKGLEDQMATIFPGQAVRVQSSRDSIVLSGVVNSTDVGDKMVQLASDYSSKVVNHLSGPGSKRRQVMLKVKFAEVSKTALTELSAVLHHVDPTAARAFDRGTAGTGEFAPPGGNLLNDPVGPDLTWGDAINLSFFEKSIDLGLFITALKTRGLFQELAEPTLIAADGQEANFLAGGEFPVPIAQPGANFVAVTIEWKKFGISLDFKPTIRDDGVIVMKVKPEVSALDFNNALLIEGFRIPSLTVRRAETEVELRSGQAFAIAGLYDRNLLQSKSKIPVLGDIPLLGYLFRSKNLTKGVTELVVIVTPTLVEPMGSEKEYPTLTMPESFELDKSKAK